MELLNYKFLYKLIFSVSGFCILCLAVIGDSYNEKLMGDIRKEKPLFFCSYDTITDYTHEHTDLKRVQIRSY